MPFRIYIMLTALVISGCAWVKPTESGKNVTLVKEYNVQNCQNLGTTTSIVKAQLGSIERSPETVKSELIALAQNQAADLGGDSIVAMNAVKDGAMEFGIYRCGQ